jgi:cellulose synthase operon protein C
MIRLLRAATLVAALGFPAPAAPGLAESWFLGRARANMAIRNYAAAVEAYRKALAADPRSREASRGVGLALLGNGDVDLAVAELDRHLARFGDDAEVAFEQARLLQWARFAYRRADAARYLRMGLAVRDDPARRRDLARLLARQRDTVPAAIAEYDRLLAASPGDRALRDERLKLLLWDASRRDEAIRELRRQRADDPSDARATRDLARLLAAEAASAGEAVSLYDALLDRGDGDPELLLGRARALSRAGRRAEAREAYARAIAARPSTEARLERAELLAADPGARAEAAAELRAVLRAEPASRRARLGLARVLSARKETSGAAIAAYEQVLRDTPRDAEAHRGLARAYAWTGDADRALAHADQAGGDDVAALARELRRGREPAIGGLARVVVQPGAEFQLASIEAGASGASEPTPFTSSAVEVGWREVRGPAGGRSEGADVSGRVEWRPAPGLQLGLAGGWAGARRFGARLEGEARLARAGERGAVSVAIRRTAREDSFRAFAGEEIGGVRTGAASETALELAVGRGDGRLRAEARLRAGAVSGAGFSPDFTAGAEGRLDRVLGRTGELALSAGVRAAATHHARELSGLGPAADPAAPRLFSPPLAADLSPRLSLAGKLGADGRLVVDGGPALQVVTGSRGAVRAGGDLRISAVGRLGERLRVSADARAERLVEAHVRYEGRLGAEVVFP